MSGSAITAMDSSKAALNPNMSLIGNNHGPSQSGPTAEKTPSTLSEPSMAARSSTVNPNSNTSLIDRNHAPSQSGLTAAQKTTSSLPSLKSSRSFPGNGPLSFFVNWICLVLTVAATIVFGIWAPLSYRITVDSNRESNDVQRDMIRAISSANQLASDANQMASRAMVVASAQSSDLHAMHTMYEKMGQLAAIEFCLRRPTAAACSDHADDKDGRISSLVEALAPPTVEAEEPESTADLETTSETASETASTTRSRSITSTFTFATSTSTQTSARFSVPATPTGNSGTTTSIPTTSPSSSVPIDVILGAVFGVIGALGIVLGYFIWRHRRRRVMLLNSE